ncbi:MAG: FAD-binding protein [Hyperionvirus sp.]|uniref:FAD-binding protein n=1 Tax=Hyperionvirus sp. TaxID=2487770 RepID=A0A3G5A9Q1_9VIRU|nr:MAG: FAD-binding protein [Hyperionvirus sp.]
MASYENFNQLYKVKPKVYMRPKSLGEFIEGVRNSKNVRVVGGNHVFNDMAICEDTIIDTIYLSGISLVGQHVKVEAGVTLAELLRYLRKYGLTLEVMTATNDISVVGGISTGSHGSCGDAGSMSSLVVGANVILADGSYREIQSEPELRAIRCSLGCLAAIHTVTLRCVEMFSIEEKRVKSYWNDESFGDILREYPYTDVHVDPHSERLGCTIVKQRKVKYSDRLGYGYKNLTEHVGSWYIEIELAFPFELYNICVGAVAEFHRRYRREHGVYTKSELYVRFSDADNTLISMCSGRRTVYVSSFFGDEYLPEIVYKFMRELSDEMVDKYRARPHWGKQHNLNIDQVRAIYGENFRVFEQMKKTIDPKGKFSNGYIDRIFSV